jgi:hypothetical protein
LLEEKRVHEISQQLTYEHYWRLFYTCPCSTAEAFFWYKAKFPVLGLLSSSAGLSKFTNYQTSD